jgi:hypothetical protein
MRRKTILVVLSVLVLTGYIASSPSAATDGNVNFLLGQKQLDDDDWEPVEDQPEFGALIDFAPEAWPVRIAIDLLGSSDEQDDILVEPGFPTVDLEGSSTELCFGVRKLWGKSGMHPFAGGGLAFVNGEIKVSAAGVSVTSEDDAIGFWVDGGISWRLGKRFNLGVDLRWSKAGIEPVVAGQTFHVEAGGLHLGALLGFGW